jgi:hypothetical protein
MSTVIGLYRFLMKDQHLGFRPQNAPWVDRTVGIEYRDKQGFKRVLEVRSADVGIRVPKHDYAWDGCIDDGGKLLPLSPPEQMALVKALKKLDNPEYELMHYVSILSGARVQTVLCLRWGDFAVSPSQINQWPFKLQCGPGTGIDTKSDATNVYLSIQRDLYERLHVYATSDRAKARREKSKRKQDPINYLFLSNQGGPYYESKDDRNALRESTEPLRRSSPTGQNLRTFINDHVIPEIQRTLPNFRYKFHDLRATFGVNWVDAVMTDGDTQERYTWARDQLRKLMWHTSASTTDRYLKYRQHMHQLEKADAGWNRQLIALTASA